MPNNQTSREISFPLPQDKTVKRVFIKAENNTASFNLTEFGLKNSPVDISWSAKTLSNLMRYGNDNGVFNNDFDIDNEKIHIQFSKKFPILVVDNELFNEMYNKLNGSIYSYAVTTSIVLGIITLLLLTLYSNKLFNPNFQLNFLLTFLTLIATPMISLNENETKENRTLAPFPDLGINIWRLPPKYTSYYNDHFPYRNVISELDNYLKIKLFNVSQNLSTFN